MSKRATFVSTCPICNRPFANLPNADGTPHKLCCSSKCAHISAGRKRRAPRVEFTCQICGKMFLDLPRRARKYCSRTCFGISKQRTGKRVIATCEHCGKKFTTRDPSGWSAHAVQRYCSHSCSGKATAIAGGLPLREEIDRICSHCGKEFTRRARPGVKYIYCSHECFWAHHRGPNHTFWQGGSDRYYGPNWEEQRAATLERDSHCCHHCGSADRPGVHHIIPRSEFERDWIRMNDLANLVTLCLVCHINIHHHPIEAWCLETLQ